MSDAALAALGVGFDGDDGPLFDGIDIGVGPGELLVVTGPAGAGKSALAAILAGVLRPSRGAVTFLGHPMPPVGAPGERPAFAPQDGALVPELTAAETVGLPLQARRLERGEIRERAERWLGILGLTPCADRVVAELSGGQRQRVSVARAFAAAAPVLVLDEPTSEIDADNRALVLSLMLAERARGAAIVAVSHDPDVEAVADRRYTLSSGFVRTA